MDSSQERKRRIIWYQLKKGKTGTYILSEIQDIFGDQCPSKATIYRWIERFDNGGEDLNDDPRPGLPQKHAVISRGFKQFWTRTNHPARVRREGRYIKINTTFDYH